jgi:hypothetical protein
MSKRGGADEFMVAKPEPKPEPDYEPEPDIDLVYPKIAVTLERLVDECGFENVLGVFSNGMPCHLRERERTERLDPAER